MLAVSFSWIARRRTHAGLQAPVRRQLHQQHRARAHVRIQRPRARRRPGRRPRHDRRQARRARAPPPRQSQRCEHGEARAPQRRPRQGPAVPAATPAEKPATVQSESNPSSTNACNGRYRNPIPFGGAPGPLRLFGKGLGDQAGWMIPFALFGLIALARIALADQALDRAGAARERGRPTAQRARRRSGRTRAPARAAATPRARDRRDRARRLVPRRGRRTEHVQGHRAPLLRLRARARHRRDGGRGRRTRSLRLARGERRLLGRACSPRSAPCSARSRCRSCCCTASTT